MTSTVLSVEERSPFELRLETRNTLYTLSIPARSAPPNADTISFARIWQKGNDMERKIKQALCLSWQEASEIYPIAEYCARAGDSLQSTAHGRGLLGVFTSGHVFTIDELVVLLTYADAKPDVCAEVFSIEGDTTKSLPSELSSLLLKKALHLNWELEYPTESGLWMLDITMEI